MISRGAFQLQLFCDSVKIFRDSLTVSLYQCVARKITFSGEICSLPMLLRMCLYTSKGTFWTINVPLFIAKATHNMLVGITSSKRSDSTCIARGHSSSNKSLLAETQQFVCLISCQPSLTVWHWLSHLSDLEM